FFQAEDGIRGFHVTGVQTCALPILARKPTASSKSAPGVRIVTTTGVGSDPGQPSRISIGSSVATLSARVLLRSPSTSRTRTRVLGPGRAEEGGMPPFCPLRGPVRERRPPPGGAGNDDRRRAAQGTTTAAGRRRERRPPPGGAGNDDRRRAAQGTTTAAGRRRPGPGTRGPRRGTGRRPWGA